jgi:predicted ATP-grasp superfamily ATP-dependent carboligase
MKILVIYGQKYGWHNFEKEERLLPYFNDKIQKIQIFTKVADLSNYLKKEGAANKIYVLPLDENHMHELYNAKINALMPKKEIVDTFRNKKLFANYANKYGLSKYLPTTYTSPKISDELVIVKPCHGGASSGVYLSPLKNLTANVFNTYVVQQYINTKTEFAGYFVAKNGVIVRPCFAYSRTYPSVPYIKAQNDKTVATKINISPNYVDDIEKFVKPSGYTGTFCVDFKLDQSGVLKVLEINPRLGGSLSYPNNSNDAVNIILKTIDAFN